MDRWKSFKNDIGVVEKHVIALAQYTKNSYKKNIIHHFTTTTPSPEMYKLTNMYVNFRIRTQR